MRVALRNSAFWGKALEAILNQTYHKTGVNRQADLVKLVAAFSNPLLN